MGSKRGRLLIRQPRVKKDSDPSSQPSPDDEPLELPSYSQHLLRVPPQKIERHASEPTPSSITSSLLSSPHLLSVPQPSFLVKQHSHPLLPSQSSSSPPSSSSFTLQRQLSYPITITTTTAASMSLLTPSPTTLSPPPPIISTEGISIPSSGSTTVAAGLSSSLTQFIATSLKTEQQEGICRIRPISPTVLIIPEQVPTTTEHIPTIRVKSEELQRSVSSPQANTRELSLDNPRSSHCPVVRPGPALGCNFCWNTIDAHGRILRRKTKYHCPECQTNLCIVPCFQEYHERQSSDTPTNENSKNVPSASLRHFPKTGSI